MTPVILYRITLVATLLLLFVGGLVRPTGSSLACPDWPTCHGEWMPEMKGIVFYEHGHRLFASLVGLLTVASAVAVFVTPTARALRGPAAAAVLLVIAQGLFGAVTVWFKLPPLVSMAHLGLGTGFAAFLAWLSVSAAPAQPLPVGEVRPKSVRLALVTLALVYAQILIGALTRHTYSGMACGNDWLLCDGTLLPAHGGGQLHLVHRFVGYLVALHLVGVAAPLLKAARASGSAAAVRGVIAAPILVVLQIILGWVAVAKNIHPHTIAAHTMIAGALLTALTFVWTGLANAATRVQSAPAPADTPPAPAAA